MKNKLRIVAVLILYFGATIVASEFLRESHRVRTTLWCAKKLRVAHTHKEYSGSPAIVAPSFSWPIDPADYKALSSPYGERDPETIGGYGDEFHNGLDLYGTWLARIRPVADGEVIVHFNPPGGQWKGHVVLGGLIVLRHAIGDDIFFTRYGHLSSTNVHEGEFVTPESLLGRQGNTGESESPHLHFELHKGGTCDIDTGNITGSEEMNPLQYLEEPE